MKQRFWTHRPLYGRHYQHLLFRFSPDRLSEEQTAHSLLTKQGEVYFIGWRWRFNDNNEFTDDVTVFQWKTLNGSSAENSQNYPFAMEYDGTTLKLSLYAPNVNKNTGEQINQALRGDFQEIRGGVFARRDTIWQRDIPEDRWFEVVLRIKYDEGTNGRISMWYNGTKQKFTNTGRNYSAVLSGDKETALHQTMDGDINGSEPPNFPKWGIYNGNSCPWKAEVFYDEIRMADSFTDANPDTHNAN